MSPTLASDMAQSSLTVLLEGARGERALSPHEARGLLASCEIGYLVLSRLWALNQECLDRGLEARKPVLRLRELEDALDLGTRAFDVARARVNAADLPPQEKVEVVATIERLIRDVAGMRSKSGGLLNWLGAPAPTIDVTSLPGNRGEREAEGYVDLKRIVLAEALRRELCLGADEKQVTRSASPAATPQRVGAPGRR